MTGDVVIVGGGVGGLSCAIALHRAGRPVRVLDRADVVATSRTALGMWPVALRALDAIGLGDKVRATGRRASAMELRVADGRCLFRLDMTGRNGDLPLLISRAALLALLLGALPAGVVHTGQRVDDPRGLGGRVLVGADGLRSVVRDAYFPGRAAPRYCGYTAWSGTVDGPTDTAMEIYGRGAKFGITPVDGGRTNWYAAAWLPETGPGVRVGADGVREAFAGWGGPVPALLDRVTDETTLRRDIYRVAPALRSFVSVPDRGPDGGPDGVPDGVALLGDAAHAMTPDAGQGACQAIVDGVTLGTLLAERDDPVESLRRYDAARRGPARRMAGIAALVGAFTMRPRLTRPKNLVLASVALGMRSRTR